MNDFQSCNSDYFSTLDLHHIKIMQENKFGFEYLKSDELTQQIAEAVKEWQISSLKYDRLLAEWHTETDENRKEILWKEYSLIQQISEGDLARLQLLADRYIEETENSAL